MAKKVLIVDDSATIRRSVTFTLSEAGFDVIEASDGAVGLEIINKTPDLDLVVMDINMPDMDGIELLETIMRDGIHHKLPVVVLTTEDEPKLIAKAKISGAKLWLVKPFKPEHLIAVVTKLLA